MSLPNSIEYQLNDHDCNRSVSLLITLNGHTVGDYVETFVSFLRAVGFHEDNIKEWINED